MTPSKAKKKLLFVDDDPAMVKMVGKFLESSLGPELIEFHEAASGENGLQKFQELLPDIVICDINLPGIKGFELCRKLRKFDFRTTIILMSAYDENEDYAIQAKEVGADAFLTKPIKKGELLFVVNFILRIDTLNQTVMDKNQQLEESLCRLQQANKKMTGMNDELQEDQRRLNDNLKDILRMNTQLESQNNQISSMNRELIERFDSTVGLLTNIIELNQSRHRGHSERVAEISVFIAQKMGLQEEEIENLRIAARLHELGIVSLPRHETVEEALNEGKSRHHTSHPLVAEMLLKGFAGFESVAELIRHMHENVDGSGMPDGLVGEQIPPGSRILSVASFYDHSMVEHPDSPVLEILKKVESRNGAWFDENVVSFLSDYILSQSPSKDEKTISCSVFALKEGMRLASDIYSESGINLLRKGTVLDRDMVNKILKFNNVDPVAGQVQVNP
ncbi:MAG: response regulator [Nitrospinota bacterium]|nr:response regulator [Nitrospinota bacterium]